MNRDVYLLLLKNWINPTLLGKEKISEIHNKLLKHDANKYVIECVQNSNKEVPEIMILRPATHIETNIVDTNYLNLELCQSKKIPCPCVCLMNGKILMVGLLPLFFTNCFFVS